ncbi:MAG: translation initiation factor IF-2 subunit beta [Candidatus Diapherotrites archaeon]
MKDETYNKLLSKAYLMLPNKEEETQRLEIPKADSFIQGTKTNVKNFGQIIKLINRPEKHFIKFLSKETATSVTYTDGKLIINGKFGSIQVNKLFDNYLKQYVYCPECKKPDTKFIEQSGIKVIKCEACGAVFPRKRV